MREMRKMKEEIKIGSRVKVREGCFNSLLLKGKVGIVVDDAGNDDVTVLFPGWNEGHDGVPFSKSERKFGNEYNTCSYIPLGMLQAVHDGFEIGDTVEYEFAGDYKTGTIVDFCTLNGRPLVEFPDADFATHPMRCHYCDPERLSPKVSKSAASVSVSTRSDGTIVVTIPRGQKVEIVSL